jgi:hypothetical protein
MSLGAVELSMNWNTLPNIAVKKILQMLSAADIRTLETTIKYTFKVSDAYWEKYQITNEDLHYDDKEEFLNFTRSLSNTSVSVHFQQSKELTIADIYHMTYLKQLTTARIYSETHLPVSGVTPAFKYLRNLTCNVEEFVELCNSIPNVTHLKLFVRGDCDKRANLPSKLKRFLLCHDIKSLAFSASNCHVLLQMQLKEIQHIDELGISFDDPYYEYYEDYGRGLHSGEQKDLAKLIKSINPRILYINAIEVYFTSADYAALTNLKILHIRTEIFQRLDNIKNLEHLEMYYNCIDNSSFRDDEIKQVKTLVVHQTKPSPLHLKNFPNIESVFVIRNEHFVTQLTIDLEHHQNWKYLFVGNSKAGLLVNYNSRTTNVYGDTAPYHMDSENNIVICRKRPSAESRREYITTRKLKNFNDIKSTFPFVKFLKSE